MLYRSPYPNSDRDELIEELKRSQSVVLFGTGNYGAMALKGLHDHGITVDYICDNNKHNWGTPWKDHEVLSPTHPKLKQVGTSVVIASLFFRYMEKQMKDIGVSRIYHSDFLLNEIELDDKTGFSPVEKLKVMADLYSFAIASEKNESALNIKSLDIVLTEKCSLKCVDCSNLMQYYESPQHTNTDDLLLAFDRFMNSIDELYELRIIGGEPLMYKQLPSIIEKLASYDHCHNLVIYTNGTIVPKSNALKVYSNSKVYFKISNYGALSRNTRKLEDTLDRYKIPFVSERVTTWQDCASIKFQNRSDELNKHIFGNCCVNDALTLLHGQLYLCPFSAHVQNLKAVPNTNSEKIDMISLDEIDIREKIRSLYGERDFIEACRHCNGRDHNVAKVDAAIQTKTPISFLKVTSA